MIFISYTDKVPLLLAVFPALLGSTAAHILNALPNAIAVANAVTTVKQRIPWHTENPGGSGAVREVCDLLLQTHANKPSSQKQEHHLD